MNTNSSTSIFVFGLIFLLLAISLACIRLRRSSSDVMLNILAGVPPASSVELPGAERGLDESTLNTFPKLLYSEALKKGSSSNNIVSDASDYSSCSICLGDYKESDTLRLLPDCGHLYHVSCVDPWLKLHPICPVCRTSYSVTSQHSNGSMEDAVINIGVV